MKRQIYSILFVLLVFPVFVFAQDYSEKLAEIDAYAQKVRDDWNVPGFAIAIVKDDKVLLAKGYGVKKLESSPVATYARLFAAVKAKNSAAIAREMSVASINLAMMAAGQQKKPIDEILKNGFSETTFADGLPRIRDLRIKGNFAAIEVYNEYGTKTRNDGKELWEDLPFIFENGDWKLAVGDMFGGKFQSPGKSFSTLESERNPPESMFGPIPKKKKPTKARTKPNLPPLVVPPDIESPLVDENTLFAIASNSKAFTTASLAILIDEKKIGGWDDKVSQYLPEFQMYDPYVTREMTIRDLVSHRSGLDTFSGDLLWYETNYSTDEVLRRVRFLKPKYGFRAQFGYQNLMFIAAGKVIERVSGKSWSAFVKERILTPLRMTRTNTSIKDDKDNFAMPHNESGGKLRVLHQGNVDSAAAAAGLNASVRDLSQWLRLQLGRGTIDGKQIFSKDRSGEMWAQNTILPVNPFPLKDAPTQMFSGYGLGWFLNDYRGHKVVSHGGGLDGMISETALMPDLGLGLVVLTNSETSVNTIMMNKILDVFLDVTPKRDWSGERLDRMKLIKARQAEADKKIDDARKLNTKPSLAPAAYAGTYSSELYGDVIVTEENGKLVLRLGPAPNFVADLEHWENDKFQIHWRPSVPYNFPRGWVTFTLNGQGKTDQLKIDQPNNDFWFYELELKRSK